MPEYPQDLQITSVQQMLSALAGATATVLAVTPADVIKTRMQLQPSRNYLDSIDVKPHTCELKENQSFGRQLKYRGFIETFKGIKEHQGLRGFYSGLTASLITTVPATTVYFVAYEQFKCFYKKTNENIKILPDMTFFVPPLSGVSTRILIDTVYSPLEMVRTKMQANKMSFAQVFKVMRNIVNTNGVAGLWYGFTPLVLRDTPFTAIYWTVYETLKAHNYNHQQIPEFHFSFLAGATAGALAGTLTTPLDVVNTRIQVEAGQNLVNADSKKYQNTYT